ncbi:permease [Dechloromonas sp. XY25]|uniref:Permease n=1 Tax=Dechloromonas hankyongensis TaxID=2908002 RepID=A0ABS9K2I6_9RHOO|nr:permease [Dechloromonas hankyongensis]MCG2577380.1 permease [Dechloromonas hankyongensis]
MSSKTDFLRRGLCGLLCAALLAGCTTMPGAKKAARVDETTPEAALTYYQGLGRMTPAELGRERMVLVAVPQTPYTQVRMAMLLGHPRVQQDLGKGLALLDSVLKSNEPAAMPFHPLARQVADNYLERLKLEGQLDKQGQQLKDSQRKTSEQQDKLDKLQEKLDSLADIERTLSRPRPVGSKR